MRFHDHRITPRREIEVWAALDDKWEAYFRVALVPGLPVVEMRVLPSHPDMWVTEWDGNPETAGRHGVPVRKIRSIRLADVLEYVERVVEESPDYLAKYVDPIAPLLGGRREVDPEWSATQRLSMLARDYVELVEAGEDRPNALLAQMWNRTPEQITADIYNARHRYQLLTQAPGRGEAGGRLTKKAQGILERMDKEGDDA